MSWIRRALTENEAVTDRDASDPRLRGRTYAISYERVWNAALGLATETRRWTVIRADDQLGEIEAEARSLVLGFVDDVSIHVRLDEEGQTRVDLASVSRRGKGDLGVNARRVGRFLTRLDRALEAHPGLILADH